MRVKNREFALEFQFSCALVKREEELHESL
jgi:hypothetical protein